MRAVVSPASPRWVLILCVPGAAILLACWLQVAGGDLWIADRIYQLQGRHWGLRDAWWTSSLTHSGGRNLSISSWLIVSVAWAWSLYRGGDTVLRSQLGYLSIAVLLSTALVSSIKQISGIDCPWDLVRYGGERLMTPYFASVYRGDGACFPAGHASAGYAWVAAWFASRAGRSGPRHGLLLLAMGAGIAFGLVQQLRGAHFLSHDLWTLALCWLVAAGLARTWWREPVATGAHGHRKSSGALDLPR